MIVGGWLVGPIALLILFRRPVQSSRLFCSMKELTLFLPNAATIVDLEKWAGSFRLCDGMVLLASLEGCFCVCTEFVSDYWVSSGNTESWLGVARRNYCSAWPLASSLLVAGRCSLRHWDVICFSFLQWWCLLLFVVIVSSWNESDQCLMFSCTSLAGLLFCFCLKLALLSLRNLALKKIWTCVETTADAWMKRCTQPCGWRGLHS